MPAPEWMFIGWPMSVWAVVVSLLGVVASTAVAIAAFRASSRANQIAIQNRADSISDGRRFERRGFYDAATMWLHNQESNLVQRDAAPYPDELSRLAHVINSDTAPKLATWLWNGARVVVAEGGPGTAERKNAYNSLVQTFGDHCALWVKDASRNHQWPPFTLPVSPTSP